jgi:hypothetical protein
MKPLTRPAGEFVDSDNGRDTHCQQQDAPDRESRPHPHYPTRNLGGFLLRMSTAFAELEKLTVGYNPAAWHVGTTDIEGQDRYPLLSPSDFRCHPDQFVIVGRIGDANLPAERNAANGTLYARISEIAHEGPPEEESVAAIMARNEQPACHA